MTLHSRRHCCPLRLPSIITVFTSSPTPHPPFLRSPSNISYSFPPPPFLHLFHNFFLQVSWSFLLENAVGSKIWKYNLRLRTGSFYGTDNAENLGADSNNTSWLACMSWVTDCVLKHSFYWYTPPLYLTATVLC